jgi:hypothetical protein
MAPDESPATRCFCPMKENIITGRITSTPERSAEIQPASDHLSVCSYLLSSTLGIGGLPDR